MPKSLLSCVSGGPFSPLLWKILNLPGQFMMRQHRGGDITEAEEEKETFLDSWGRGVSLTTRGTSFP